MAYDLREKLLLIGYSTNQIIATNNLPTIGQMLASLFYNIRRISKNLHISAMLTIEECLIIWKKARIPAQRIDKCIEKLKGEYDRYRNVTKSSHRRSTSQIQKEKEYKESINNLFDIASANALDTMTDESDKKFLMDQRALIRSENPTSNISNADAKEILPMEVDHEVSNAKDDESLTDVNNAKDVDASTILKKKDHPTKAQKELLHEILGSESESPTSQSTPPLKRRATEPIMTAKLATVLDKCHSSKREAMHLLMASAEAFGIDPRNFVINPTSLHNARKKFREERFEAIKKMAPNLFSDSPSTIHWDGKILPEFLRKESADRLAIIVTCGELEQLLGVPKLSSGTGANQAQAVFDCLTDWCLLNNIEALCCDSTSSNTGRKNGACVLLERFVDKELLYFICRHHIYEIVPKSIFEIKFGKSTGPDVTQFKEFENFWKSIDKTNYEPGINDSFVNKSLYDVKEDILKFSIEYLKKDLIRNDYKEFLELVIIFLGGKSSDDIKFHPPGAIHHARWMAKAIYCLKIYIFRKQYLSNNRENELKYRDVCIFIIRAYTQAWFCSPFAAQAPNQDLNFLKCLYEYKRIDQSISDCAVKKFINHLWYLTPEMTALAFFDANIPVEEKLKMCEALKSSCSTFVYDKRILTNERNVKDLVNSSICDFICKDTYKFFERFKINKNFLEKHPSKWPKDRDFIHGSKIVKSLRVVNDTAERGVKLMSEFNNLLTKDSQQSQYLLPVINDYRNLFPDNKNDTLMKPYE